MILFNIVLTLAIVTTVVLAEVSTIQIVNLSIYFILYSVGTIFLLGLGTKMGLGSVLLLWEVLSVLNLTFGELTKGVEQQ